ncbi:MAG TPA: AsmA-like C-terminal region-containing protein [Vicinamibacterales bacterium]|nr:AsmA-like C-terminal region-containing protein [Vicinamibacterales bacterium]
MKPARWFIGIVGGVLVGLWIALTAVSRAPVLQKKLIETLNDQLDAQVELESFTVDSFPTLRIYGDNLRLRLKDQQQAAPFIEIRHFEVAGGILGLLRKQRRFTFVELVGLRITIPPRTPDDKEAGSRAAATVDEGPVLIDHVIARDAQLVIVPRDPRKEPKVWTIHHLDLQSVGFNRAMPFLATLTNPIPKGDIATQGTFGPWRKREPGLTPLSGTYKFERADLNTIKGIGGTLTSTGEFAGYLEEIQVKGTTDTPDFTLDVGGVPVPLVTTFQTVVDGTNGNTYLKQVDAMLDKTPIAAAGAIESQPGVKGRHINLDVRIADGRIQDVLRLAVKAKTPVMLGRLAMEARLVLPPGESPVADRLSLNGRFALENAHFTDRDVQEQIKMLSRRAQGKTPTDPIGRIDSDMRGRFTLRDGMMRFHPFGFDVPGADVEVRGVYGLRSEYLDFTGTLNMDAPISKAAGGGIKGFFLKPFDPIFRKNGKGAVIPITIKGPREQPKFGMDWGKVFK